MTHSKIQTTIYNMLTTNTGTHMCDSGGSDGRMWQRNQKLTIEDFIARPQAYMELSLWDGNIEATATIDIFHYLTNNLELDELCDEFNAMSCDDWNSDEFYGVSSEGEDFLTNTDRFKFSETKNFNTYNWDNPFSQVMQGRELTCQLTGDRYVLLQIHNGADVRGGYTDAKLFKLSDNCDYFLSDYCYFDMVDYRGEWFGHDGSSASDELWRELATKYELSESNDTVVINGGIL